MRASVTLALLLTTLGAGCAPLPPWSRGRLLEAQMDPAPSPLEGGFDSHVHETLEGVAGATPSSGPSCGCN